MIRWIRAKVRLSRVADDVPFQITEERHHVARQPGDPEQIDTDALRLVRQIARRVEGIGVTEHGTAQGKSWHVAIRTANAAKQLLPTCRLRFQPAGGGVLCGIGKVACRNAMAVTSPTVNSPATSSLSKSSVRSVPPPAFPYVGSRR